jgi:TPR repeat protein
MESYAVALEYGIGVIRDMTLATTWYRKAAAAGNKAAIVWCNDHAVPYGIGSELTIPAPPPTPGSTDGSNTSPPVPTPPSSEAVSRFNTSTTEYEWR